MQISKIKADGRGRTIMLQQDSQKNAEICIRHRSCDKPCRRSLDSKKRFVGAITTYKNRLSNSIYRTKLIIQLWTNNAENSKIPRTTPKYTKQWAWSGRIKRRRKSECQHNRDKLLNRTLSYQFHRNFRVNNLQRLTQLLLLCLKFLEIVKLFPNLLHYLSY